MKKIVKLLLIAFILILLADQFIIFSPFFSIQANESIKQTLQNEIKKHHLLSFLIPKKKLHAISYRNLIPQYLHHNLRRNGLRYVLEIDETFQHIPIELNHQSWFVNSLGEILTSTATNAQDQQAEDYLFRIQIRTTIDQLEAYRIHVKDFIFFLLTSANTIGPSIKNIQFDDLLGLSYTDYRDITYLLGTKPDYERLSYLLDIVSSDQIEKKIKENSYNEVDLRFEKKIILRIHHSKP
jgi:hypothetical protein